MAAPSPLAADLERFVSMWKVRNRRKLLGGGRELFTRRIEVRYLAAAPRVEAAAAAQIAQEYHPAGHLLLAEWLEALSHLAVADTA